MGISQKDQQEFIKWLLEHETFDDEYALKAFIFHNSPHLNLCVEKLKLNREEIDNVREYCKKNKRLIALSSLDKK